MKQDKLHHGFSLIELAVVILITGILFNMISLSFNLIKQAYTRRLVTEINDYAFRIESFRTKYNAIPGDYNLAYNEWKTECASSAAECNGNGDNIINWNSGIGASENLMAWRHLVLSGIYFGDYSGVATTAGQSDFNINIPRSSWPSAGMQLYTEATQFSGYNGFGVQIAGFKANSWACNPNVFTATEARAIDIKLDDGELNTGMMRAIGDCLTNNDPDIKNCYIRYSFYQQNN